MLLVELTPCTTAAGAVYLHQYTARGGSVQSLVDIVEQTEFDQLIDLILAEISESESEPDNAQ